MQALSIASTHADFIRFTVSAELVSTFGPDNLGLDGATFELTTDYDIDSVYSLIFGEPAIRSINDSLVISGATWPGVDGTYQEDFGGLTFLPNFSGTLFGGASRGDFASWQAVADAHPIDLNFLGGFFVEPVGGVSVGDTVDVSHFGFQPIPNDFVFQNNFPGATYGAVDFQAIVTVVPEPSTGAMYVVLVFTSTFVSRRRRRTA